MPDWAWLIPMNVIMIASIVWDAIRRERISRQIRRDAKKIGQRRTSQEGRGDE